eukprot:scaffold67818_cov69-Phaeocystis_antarctica.AAC.2
MSTRAGLPRACRSLCDVPQHRLVKLAHSRGSMCHEGVLGKVVPRGSATRFHVARDASLTLGWRGHNLRHDGSTGLRASSTQSVSQRQTVPALR